MLEDFQSEQRKISESSSRLQTIRADRPSLPRSQATVVGGPSPFAAGKPEQQKEGEGEDMAYTSAGAACTWEEVDMAAGGTSARSPEGDSTEEPNTEDNRRRDKATLVERRKSGKEKKVSPFSRNPLVRQKPQELPTTQAVVGSLGVERCVFFVSA